MQIKRFILFSFLLNLFGLNSQQNYIHEKKFASLLDSFNVEGSILIFDSKENTYYSNDFIRANKGFIPASTFKIPNSIIGLELGILSDENTVFKWNGEKRRMSTWEKDLTLKEAFKVSCVPCYQELATNIGTKRMKKYLKKLEYKNMIFNNETVNDFWLTGESKISQLQQIEFLNRFYSSKLPIKETTLDVMKKIMLIEKTPEYSLSGKTGWGVIQDENIGWYVGYLEKNEKVYFFAVNINSTEKTDMNNFTSIRLDATKQAFNVLGVVE